MRSCTCASAYICVVCVYVCIHVYVRVYMYICARVRPRTQIAKYVCVCQVAKCVCVCQILDRQVEGEVIGRQKTKDWSGYDGRCCELRAAIMAGLRAGLTNKAGKCQGMASIEGWQVSSDGKYRGMASYQVVGSSKRQGNTKACKGFRGRTWPSYSTSYLPTYQFSPEAKPLGGPNMIKLSISLVVDQAIVPNMHKS